MKNVIRVAIVTAAVMSMAQTSAPTGDAKNGKKLFAADGCYQCHGYEAQGATPTGPRLGPKPIAFAQFQKYVRQPSGQMPPYTTKSIPDKDLADIYAFLQSLPTPPAVDSIPALK
ncbi:MAG TPA: cytochrome c [Vicinamibacterales bacterium]|nr:cytochrome c [Vicinamibacterales bacterium]